jgi:hypothetical protein
VKILAIEVGQGLPNRYQVIEEDRLIEETMKLLTALKVLQERVEQKIAFEERGLNL